MLTFAQAQAARPRYSCVCCQHALTEAQAWYSERGQATGPGYFCKVDAPADARPVVPATGVVTP